MFTFRLKTSANRLFRVQRSIPALGLWGRVPSFFNVSQANCSGIGQLPSMSPEECSLESVAIDTSRWSDRSGAVRGRRWFRLYRAAAWLSIVSGGLCALTGTGAQAQSSEYDVKAAYLFNFGKFIRVNGSRPQRSTFDICILGHDPIGHTMDDIVAHEAIDGRPVRVLRLADASQGRSCDIVFMSAYESDNIREDLALLDDSSVLTVSDAPDFMALGGMIQFVLEADRVRFEVNLDAVDRAHLVLSSELLRVAAAVEGTPQGARR